MNERPTCEECGRVIPEGETPFQITVNDNGGLRWKIVCKKCIAKEAEDAERKAGK